MNAKSLIIELAGDISKQELAGILTERTKKIGSNTARIKSLQNSRKNTTAFRERLKGLDGL